MFPATHTQSRLAFCRAFAKTYATNYHMKKDGSMYNYYGVYEDDMVKTSDGWRIKSRKQYPFFTTGETAPDPK